MPPVPNSTTNLGRMLPFVPKQLRWGVDRIAASSIAKQLLGGTFWNMAGVLALQGATLITLILLSRTLGIKAFGEFGLIRSTVAMFSDYAGFGLGLLLVKYVSEWIETDKPRAGRIIAFCYGVSCLTAGIFSVVLFLCSPYICNGIIDSPHIIYSLRLGILLFIALVYNGIQYGLLGGFHYFHAIFIAKLVSGLLMIPAVIFGAKFYGMDGAILGFSLATGSAILISAYFVRKAMQEHVLMMDFRHCLREVPILWKSALPTALNVLAFAPTVWVCYLLVARQSGGTSMLALVVAAVQLNFIMTFVTSQTWRVFLASASAAYAKSNYKAMRKIIGVNLLVNIVSTSIIALPFFLMPAFFMALYGDSYTQGALILRIFCLIALIQAIYNALSIQVIGVGKMWTFTSFSFTGGCVQIAMTAAMTYHVSGGMAFAVGQLSNAFVMLVALSVYTLLRIKKQDDFPGRQTKNFSI